MPSPVKISAFTSLTIAPQTIHTVFAERKLTVKMIHIANVTGAAATVQIHFVPPGDAAAVTNAALYDFSIPSNDFIELGEGQILFESYAVIGACSVDNAINITVCGLEE